MIVRKQAARFTSELRNSYRWWKPKACKNSKKLILLDEKAIICNFTSSTRESISTQPNWIQLYPKNQFASFPPHPNWNQATKQILSFPQTFPTVQNHHLFFFKPSRIHSTTPTNQINQHPKKNDQPALWRKRRTSPRRVALHFSGSRAKAPGRHGLWFRRRGVPWRISDWCQLWWQAYIPGMIDISIQRLLDKTLNLIASHPWVDIKKETMFLSRPWKKLWSVDTTQKSCFMIGRNYNQPYKILWLFRVESQCLNLQLQKFFNLLNDLTWEVRKATWKSNQSPPVFLHSSGQGVGQKNPQFAVSFQFSLFFGGFKLDMAAKDEGRRQLSRIVWSDLVTRSGVNFYRVFFPKSQSCQSTILCIWYPLPYPGFKLRINWKMWNMISMFQVGIIESKFGSKGCFFCALTTFFALP